MKILIVTTRQLTGLNYHRQITPHNHLVSNYDSYEVRYSESLDNVDDNELKSFNIVSFLRIVDVNGRSKEIIDRAKSFGAITVLDIDDFWELHPFHEQRKLYIKSNYSQQTVDSITNVDYITTTTPIFADKLKEYNKNVEVLPNSIWGEELQFRVNPTESDRVRLGWIGGVFHYWDIIMMRDGFKDVYRNINKDKFQFLLGGYNKQYENYEKVFTVDGKYYDSGSYGRLNALPPNKYAAMYNEIDVALVPLRHDIFNSFKSQIKIIEAGWFKKAVIVSNVKPYTLDCDKYNSILVEPRADYKGWGTAMRSMILNKNRREDLAEQLHEDVIYQYDMNKTNIIRDQFYKQITK